MPEPIVQICSDLAGLRQLTADKWGIAATDWGDFWLPIIHSARGSVFAEVISTDAQGKYVQPIDLDDRQRQPLYRFGFQLLDHLQAPPAVYLVQFGWHSHEKLLFDRLIPFPDAPAIASVGVQTPHLFACHWLCLTRQPIPEIITRS